MICLRNLCSMLRLGILGLAMIGVAAGAAAQGYNLLVGGGSSAADCDPGDGDWSDGVYGWLVNRAQNGGPNGGNGKILIVDYEAYPECSSLDPVGECAFFECLGAVQADHACITKRGKDPCLKASDQAAYDLILQYDALWFSGGDQSQYVSNLQGTVAEDAIHQVWVSGGALGGTSAGAMIQSEIASIGDAPSWEATGDPYKSTIQLTTDFLAGSNVVLPDTIVDTHFTGRARMGRLAVFLGRLLQDDGRSVLGIGVDTETALAVTPDGVGEVMGEGSVWLVQPTATTVASLQSSTPPHISDLKVDILTEGFRYDFGLRQVVHVPASADAAAAAATRSYQTVTISGSSDGDIEKADRYIAGMASEYSLWYGTMTVENGTGGIGNGFIATNLEDDTTVRENRAGGPLWGLKQYPSQGLAVYTDGYAGDSCNQVQVGADEILMVVTAGCPDEQSVVVLDCCGLEWVDQSTWDSDGNGLPRQSVALTPCSMTLLSSQLGPGSYDATCGGGCTSTCGNDLRECDEPCDGTDLGGETCQSQGFDDGTLACLTDCSGFDLSQCFNLGCGNGTCDLGEDSCNCAADCGAPPATETDCSDGIDNDCDGDIDSDDSDCGSCLPPGSPCSSSSECCSDKCVGKPGSGSCK
jgi:cyanophycinase